jgi:hypothetical protein
MENHSIDQAFTAAPQWRTPELRVYDVANAEGDPAAPNDDGLAEGLLS